VPEGEPASPSPDDTELSLRAQIKSLQEAQVKQRLEFRLFSTENAAMKSQLDTITDLIQNMPSTQRNDRDASQETTGTPSDTPSYGGSAKHSAKLPDPPKLTNRTDPTFKYWEIQVYGKF
jgi:hypothetical protein